MYEAFYGLREAPFAAAGAEGFFPTASSQEARESLERCLTRGSGVSLLVGPTGCGKSLLCEVVAQTLRKHATVVHLGQVRLTSPKMLLQAVMHHLGLRFQGMDEGELRLAVLDYVTRCETSEVGMVLLVDDAHLIGQNVLLEVQSLARLGRPGSNSLPLLLAGGPALEERLSVSALESLCQSITARAYLSPFTAPETAAYMRRRLEQAGGNPESLLADDAYAAVQQATDGLPRLINQLADHLLLLGFLAGRQRLNADDVAAAWSDLQQLPAPWSAGAIKVSTGAESSCIEFGELPSEMEPNNSWPAGDLVAEDATSRRFDEIDSHLHALAETEPRARSKQPEVEFVFREPMQYEPDAFDEEEVIIDRYAEFAPQSLMGTPRVESTEGRILSELLDRAEPVSSMWPTQQIFQEQLQSPAEEVDGALRLGGGRLNLVGLDESWSYCEAETTRSATEASDSTSPWLPKSPVKRETGAASAARRRAEAAEKRLADLEQKSQDSGPAVSHPGAEAEQPERPREVASVQASGPGKSPRYRQLFSQMRKR